MREARRIARKPVWVTELDWTGGDDRYSARELRRFARGFRGPTYWYHLQDSRRAPRAFAKRGLFTEKGKPKQIWKELLRTRAPL